MSSLDSVVVSRVAEQLKLDVGIVARALKLLRDGLPVSYLSRYRRDGVGGLDESTLREMRTAADRVLEMEQRREFILRAVGERKDVSDKMRRRIERCRSRLELEYLYEPFRPPRKTPGSIARARGLESLAEALMNGKDSDADGYIDEENGLVDPEQVFAGARHILAERFSVDPDVRGAMLRAIEKEGVIRATPAHGKKGIPERFRKFEGYEEKLSRVPPHRFLALRRAENEGALSIRVAFPEEKVQATIEQRFYPKECGDAAKAQLDLVASEVARLMRPAISEDALREAKSRADTSSISVFANNLNDLLLYPPAGMRRVMGVDPSPRGAIPVACVDERGQHLEHARLKFFDKNEDRLRAVRETLVRMVTTHKVEMVALGNGQGRHPCEAFLSACFAELGEDAPAVVVVNEVGVGSYASGSVGRTELPALPVPARGAVSIARRLMDPLRELVKVDAKLICAGQYQADVDARRLTRALSEVVTHCVSWVGVDVNRAPIQQLAGVGGITMSVARSLGEHREKHGPFRTLANLKDLPFISERAFMQAGGFLRIHGGDEPLDGTGVHPDHHGIVDRIAEKLGVQPAELIGNADLLAGVVADDYADAEFSPATIAGVLSELVEAGTDPRPPLEVIRRPAGVNTAADLEAEMKLQGRVTNVTSFGAFVDIGVQQDGLVHVSELADRFVKDPTAIVHVGQLVDIRVLGVDSDSGRISLSMKSGRPRLHRDKGGRGPRRDKGQRPRRGDRPPRRNRDVEPVMPPPEPEPEPVPEPMSENPVPSGMTEEEFMKHKLEELKRRFG